MLSGLSGGIVAGRALRPRRRRARRRHLRHGRHERRHRARARRRDPVRARLRARVRPADRDAGDRPGHARRGRRLDRLGRRRRAAARRAAERRRGPGPGLLRPRRHGADRDRREPRARPDRRRLASSAAACSSTRAGRTTRSRGSASASGSTPVAAAEAVIEIANEGMAGTIRRVAVERGVDPRDFELVAFGGAGPLHAAEIAASLGMAGVIVPPHPGLASAFGTLLADRRVDRRATLLRALGRRRRRRARRAASTRWSATHGRRSPRRASPASRRSCGRSACATPGQNHELDVPLPPGRSTSARSPRFAAFHALHHEVYGYSFPGETVELIARERGRARPGRPHRAGRRCPRASCRRRASSATCASPATTRSRRRSTGARTCRPARCSRGPAVVEELDSTTLVLPGQELRVLAGRDPAPLGRQRSRPARRRGRSTASR